MGVGEVMAREEMGTPEVEGEILLFALPFLTLYLQGMDQWRMESMWEGLMEGGGEN